MPPFLGVVFDLRRTDFVDIQFDFRTAFKSNKNPSVEDIVPNDLAIFTPDTDFFTDFRKAFPQFHIGFVLIGEAAHETAALTGDFCGIEREALLFGHFDGYGVEFFNKSGTTDFTAASADAAAHLCLVADAHLAHLDSGTKFFNKLFYQLTEVNPAIGCEKEGQPACVKGAFNRKQIHLEFGFFNALLAEFICTGFQVNIFFPAQVVIITGDAENLFERFPAGGGFHRCRREGHCPEPQPFLGFHDDVFALFEHERAAVEMIYFTCWFESYSNNFFHMIALGCTSGCIYSVWQNIVPKLYLPWKIC